MKQKQNETKYMILVKTILLSSYDHKDLTLSHARNSPSTAQLTVPVDLKQYTTTWRIVAICFNNKYLFTRNAKSGKKQILHLLSLNFWLEAVLISLVICSNYFHVKSTQNLSFFSTIFSSNSKAFSILPQAEQTLKCHSFSSVKSLEVLNNWKFQKPF